MIASGIFLAFIFVVAKAVESRRPRTGDADHIVSSYDPVDLGEQDQSNSSVEMTWTVCEDSLHRF
jgi:hypothetical protein